MKTLKAVGLLAFMLVVLAFSGTAYAEKAISMPSWKNGGTLWDQARIEWGTGKLWKVIAARNDISDPKKIRVGQKIIIPDVDTVEIMNHMTSPFGAKAEKGNEKVLNFIQEIEIPEHVKFQLTQAVRYSDPEAYVLMKGEEAMYVSDGKGIYGNNKTVFIFNWKAMDFLKAQRWSVVIDNTAYELVIIESCGNANLRWKSLPKGKEKEEIATDVPIPVIIQEPEPEPKLEQKKVVLAKKEPERKVQEFDPEAMFEIFVGGGISDNVYDDIDSTGYFAWTEARFHPLKYSFKNFNLKLGVFIKGGVGGGESGTYNYHNKYYLAGLSIKPYGDTWDMNAGIGLGRQWKKGGKDNYRSQQEERLFGINADLSGYKNRLNGDLWMPKWTLDFQYTKPYDVDHQHQWKGRQLEPNPYDSERIEGGLTQFVYDFWSDDGLTRITPGIRIGGGHEWGSHKAFVRAGPRLQFATYKRTVLSIGYDFKEQLHGKGDNNIYAGSLNLIGLFDWFRILSIREAHADELSIPINFHD